LGDRTNYVQQGVLGIEGVDPPTSRSRERVPIADPLRVRTLSVPSKSLKRPLWPKMRQEGLR
jgi:hypothetical protein